MAIEVVKVTKEKNNLHVTVRGGTVNEVTSPESRRVAYDVRTEHGFERSGINSNTGAYPVDLKTKNKDGHCKPIGDMKELAGRNSDLAFENIYTLVASV